jgi:asparagine synthase (glutamine-hydrolysing)
MHIQSYYECPVKHSPDVLEEAALHVRALVGEGVREREIADVPVCTLLSGGIDSAAVAHHLAASFPQLVAYIAVYDKQSRDLRCAREVAEMCGVELVEVPVEVPSADDLARVVGVIEMPHKAQIEIGWACLALARRMHADGFKVTFSGEGSDELWASYGFAYHALKTQNWHTYRRDLFTGQHRKNFARCNKIFMAHSIECRLPYLNTNLVEYAISLDRNAVQDGKSKPKAVIQEAYAGLLPKSITARPKLAFQDGMGIKRQIAQVLPDPARFYRAEYRTAFRGVAA